MEARQDYSTRDQLASLIARAVPPDVADASLDALRSAHAALDAAPGRQPRVRRERTRDPGVDAFRAQHARPPAHLPLTRAEIEREERRATRARDRARLRTGVADTAIAPSWTYRLASRIHAGRAAWELAQLPDRHRRAIERAAARYRSPAAQASVIALGCNLVWLSLRHPRRCGRPSTIAGLAQATLASWTRRRDGRAYSLSSVAHRWHGRGETIAVDGARHGTGEHAGFLAALVQEGALLVWLPPSDVDRWMLGDAWPFACYRATPDVPPDVPPLPS